MKLKNIKIGYFADGPWSHEAFRLLIQDPNISIQFIVPRFDTTDLTLFQFAEQFNIDYFLARNINTPDFLKKINQYNCDLFVSMSFNQIFGGPILNLPQFKTINCHAGKLPFYRGRNILNWALINDEKDFGITVHYVDEGVDTGDIILQRLYPITEEDDYGTLLNSAHKNCAKDLYDAIKLIQMGRVNPVKQDTIHALGFYCGIRKEGDERVNWNQSSRDLFNFIRAICTPGPMARTTVNENIVKINKAKMIADAPIYKCFPGLIVGKTENGFVVKTGDSTLEICELESVQKIRIGDRLV